MNRRPWPIVILALLHWIEPINKTILLGFINNLGPFQVINALWSTSPWWSILVYFGLFPFAGLCIYWMRPWSFYAFLAIHLVALGDHMMAHRELMQSGNYNLVFIWVVMSILNISVVSYFFAPIMLKMIYDRRQRWWETKPRYRIDVPCELYDKEKNISIDGKLLNLSEGGGLVEVLMQVEGDIPLMTPIILRIPLLGHDFAYGGKIVHSRKKGVLLLGMQFEFTSYTEAQQIKAFVELLKTFHFQQEEKMETVSSFSEWFTAFVKTGEGLYPELTPKPQTNRINKNGVN